MGALWVLDHFHGAYIFSGAYIRLHLSHNADDYQPTDALTFGGIISVEFPKSCGWLRIFSSSAYFSEFQASSISYAES